MHSLICSLVVAVMALFPGSAGEGGLNLRAWMEAYETRLCQQMEENFKREQATSKEAVLQEMDVEPTVVQTVVETSAETVPETTAAPSTEASEPEPQADTERGQVASVAPLFSVNGAVLDIGVQEYLYQRLCEANIGWFYHYAILIAYQESRFDFYAVNQKNHLDMGLFQYRSTFWNYGDIFNPYDQINVFTIQMMQRANVGCSVAEMISRHKTSDWGSYDQEYVNQVIQWESKLVRVR